MGERKLKSGIKGDAYKKDQRVAVNGKYHKPARITDKWMIKHGWKKNEEGKWEHS